MLDSTPVFLRRAFRAIWIPAFAGMTELVLPLSQATGVIPAHAGIQCV
jgi:hypothetical protein